MAARCVLPYCIISTLASMLALPPAAAACGDRPGTPDNVSAEVQTASAIRMKFRITTRDKEVNRYYDVKVIEVQPPAEPGRLPVSTTIRNLAGVRAHGPYFLGYGGIDHFDFPGLRPGTKHCFRIRARTEAGTKGCVSALWSGQVCATTSGAALHHGPDTCKAGFVWREALRSDHVCVSPQTRDEVKRDNAAARERRLANGTCLSGFV